MFPAPRRKTLAVWFRVALSHRVLRATIRAKRSDVVRLVRRAANVDAGRIENAARVSGTVVPKYIVAVGRATVIVVVAEERKMQLSVSVAPRLAASLRLLTPFTVLLVHYRFSSGLGLYLPDVKLARSPPGSALTRKENFQDKREKQRGS